MSIMPKTYSWRFQVRTYDVGGDGLVSPTNLQRYLEEGATQASASAGYDINWYRENNRLWVLRTATIRYYLPVTYPDELELTTWVSDFRRVQSHRDYALHRVADGQLVLRGRGNWVFINTVTMQPIRVPAEFMEQFGPLGELEELDAGIPEGIVVEDPIVHTEERRVQRYELDSNGHVNNAVYLMWAEQATVNALREVGWPPERLSNEGFDMWPVASEVEYYRSALDDEPIWIVTRLAEVGLDRAAWHNEIRHGATGELIAKAVLMRAFADENGPRSIPDTLQLALVKPSRV
jgi:YbgC/YbaW family acyl-CoA thioester hydrolase